MKSTGKILLLFAMIGLMAACNNETGGEAAKTGEAQDVEETSSTAMMYNVNTQSTSVIWTGSKPTGTHQGVIKVTGGELAVNNGNIEGGSFNFDMNSLAVTDLISQKTERKNWKVTSSQVISLKLKNSLQVNLSLQK